MFPPDLIFSCAAQAVGILEMRAAEAKEREQSIVGKRESTFGLWRRVRGGSAPPGTYVTVILTTLLSGAVTTLTTWLAFRMGWVGAG